MPFEIRPASFADLAACRRVWLATETAPAPAGDPSDILPLHRHELDTGRILVATADREVVGFGATLVRSHVAYVADLFVRPDFQSGGVGRQLLHGLLDDHNGARFTLASSDARALHLYRAFGMRPVCDVAYLAANPDDLDLDRLARLAADTSIRPISLGAAAFALDRAITGRDRAIDLEYTERELHATTLQAERDGSLVGFCQYVGPTSWNPIRPDCVRIGPVVASAPEAAVGILAAGILAAARLETRHLEPFVPETHAAFGELIAAGFSVVDRDRLVASDAALIDTTRYFPAVDTA